jgi:hypothetical protein
MPKILLEITFTDKDLNPENAVRQRQFSAFRIRIANLGSVRVASFFQLLVN